MAEVLSQSEIDALLMAVTAGEVATETPAVSKDVRQDWISYDLTLNEKIIQGRYFGLIGIYERFAQSFRATLTRLLKRNVVVTVASTEFVKFQDHASTITVPTALNVVSMKELKDHLVFQVGAKFAYAAVDAYYGGAERPYSKIGGGAEFTHIETMMIQKLAALAVTDLQAAWRPNYPLSLEWKALETNPNFIGVVHPHDPVVVTTIDIDFDNLTGFVAVILPIRPLEPIAQALAINVTSFGDEEVEAWKRHWDIELNQTPLDIRVELGSTQKTFNGLQSLKVGDILILDQEATGQLKVYVEGQPKILGMMGICHGNAAVRLTDFVTS